MAWWGRLRLAPGPCRLLSSTARSPPLRVLAIATMDTKAEEAAFLVHALEQHGLLVAPVDVSCAPLPPSPPTATTPRERVAAHHPKGARHVLSLPDRGDAVGAMSDALQAFVRHEAASRPFAAVIGIGGSSGTAIITPAMQALPVGLPKLMVTTMASGDVSAYVGCADVTIMPSVVDVAGLNSISRAVLRNAAAAIAGMASSAAEPVPADPRPTLALTMFGVTTPCCDAVREALSDEFEVLTFHATGSGGRAMEKLLSSGMLAGVLDLTTTEVADEVVGGVLSAGPARLDALAECAVPAVISVGAMDMVNFGSRDSVPPQFASRQLHEHNAQVTLMRTTADELRQAARFIAQKLNRALGPVCLLLPEGGVSALDQPGMPFDDAAAREALFSELAVAFETGPTRSIRRVAAHINSPDFARAAVEEFRRLHALSPPLPHAPSTAAAPSPPLPSPPLPPAPPGPRDAVLASLRRVAAAGRPIIGAGAGTGISAKFEEAGGADLIIVYNSGRFRMGGHGSLAGMLPFKDANAVMLEMGDEILPVLRRTPLLAGVCATDPFRSMEALLRRVKEMGFAGVQNFPTVGLIDGTFRQNLEETGMGYEKEVQMVAAARALGLLTTPYCFNEDEATRMAAVGADVIVAHMGLTTSGSIGAATAFPLDECVRRVRRIAEAARRVNPQVLVLAHGGAISMPADAEYVQRRVRGLDGFYGASSMERLPVEVAITEQIRKFKDTRLYDPSAEDE
ncbi:hypothetical protein AB1Y20_011839 [Prymnesium parvum]|uniref:Uncharacterized protein n=1 Tax=Prymnesium parvum TaxID=97485 RepID=A0AB34IK21_PRYPA